MSELIIDESNFSQYFFDVRTNKPQRGQVIACYTAVAELVEHPHKRNIVDLLRLPDKAIAASQLMRKFFHASEKDSVRVPREIVEDILKGMSTEEICQKPYKYTVECYYYTKPEYVPKNDPHWTCINVLNMDEFTEEVNGITIKSKLIAPKNAPVLVEQDDEETESAPI